MNLTELSILGSYQMSLPVHSDSRGTFENLFPDEGLDFLPNPFTIRQVNLSRNLRKGTLRGLHFQRAPHAEGKVVSCLVGAAFDVIVDLRSDSISFGVWQSIYLEPSLNSLYVPPGVAHGFQTLEDGSVLQYLHSERYFKSHGSGVRFDDPELKIRWPLEVTCISLADQQLPTLAEMRRRSEM